MDVELPAHWADETTRLAAVRMMREFCSTAGTGTAGTGTAGTGTAVTELAREPVDA